MPTLETFVLFGIADLALKLTPGPDMALTLSRGITQGFRAAWVSALGTSSAGFVHVPLVVLGLAALFSQSPLLFTAVKTAGALYLIYLGVHALLRSRRDLFPDAHASLANDQEIFLQGFVTNLLNPKVLLFMVVFLPQFADPALGPLWIQMCLRSIRRSQGCSSAFPLATQPHAFGTGSSTTRGSFEHRKGCLVRR